MYLIILEIETTCHIRFSCFAAFKATRPVQKEGFGLMSLQSSILSIELRDRGIRTVEMQGRTESITHTQIIRVINQIREANTRRQTKQKSQKIRERGQKGGGKARNDPTAEIHE